MTTTHQTVRPPKQQRSRASYERVLDAARQLLEENGFEGFTVQEVAARANVSVGAIYERFGNKDTLLHTVHARLMETISQFDPDADDGAASASASASASVSASASASAAAGVGALIDLSVRRIALTMDAHRAILRAFMHLGALDDVIAERGSLEGIELGRRFKATLRPHAAEFGHTDPEVALDIAFRVTYSTLARRVMYGPVFESDLDLGWDELTAELTRVCRAYLLAEPELDPRARSAP